jgi:hypothetical protein
VLIGGPGKARLQVRPAALKRLGVLPYLVVAPV